MAVATKRIKTYVTGTATITGDDQLERYKDAGTVIGGLNILAVERFSGKDQATVVGHGEITGVDGYNYTDAATVTSHVTISAALSHGTVDAITVTGVAVISAAETRERLDAATVIGVADLTNTTQSFAAIDAGTVIAVDVISTAIEYDDAATVISVGKTTEINLDSFIAIDQATIIGVAPISGVDNMIGSDAATVIGNASDPGYTDFPDDIGFPGDIIFSGDIGYTISAVEQFNGVDQDTVIGSELIGQTWYDGWVLDLTDGSLYPGSNVFPGDDIFPGDVGSGGGLIPVIAARVAGVAVISSFENFEYHDADNIIGVGFITSDEIFQRSIESSTIIGVGIPSAEEIQIGASTMTVEFIGIIATQSGGGPFNPVNDERFQANRTGKPAMEASVVSTDFATFTDTGSGAAGMSMSGTKVKTITNAIDGYVNGGTITNVTNASPPVVTAAGNGFVNGQRIYISGVVGATGANGLFKVAGVSGNDFTLNTEAGGNPAAPGAYTSGGQCWNGFYPIFAISAATNATPIQVTAAGHGLVTNDLVKIVNGLGNTAVNGTWIVTFVDANNITLNNSVGNGVYTASSANMAKMSGTPYVTNTTDLAGLALQQKYNAG